jgi:hypothetical protein
MTEKVTVYIRGENGIVKPHDLPLPWGVQDRLGKGQVVQVDAPAGQPAAEPAADAEPESLPRPVVNASKDEWARYARSVDPDLTEDDTKAMTKADLIDRY